MRAAHSLIAERMAGWMDPLYGWRWSLDEVADFAARHGRLPVNGAQDTAEKRLGSWLNTQQQNIKKGRLSEEQVSSMRAGHPLVAERVAS